MLHLINDESVRVSQDSKLQLRTLILRSALNPLNLIAIENSRLTNIPLEMRRPGNEIENCKTVVQALILIRNLLLQFTNKVDSLLPFTFDHGSSLTAKSVLDLSETFQESVSCTLAVLSGVSSKLLVQFVIDPDVMLLTTRHPTRLHLSVIEIIVSFSLCEAFLHRHDGRILHITIKSQTRPHPACRRLKLGQQQKITNNSSATSADEDLTNELIHIPIWNLTLLFEHTDDTMIVKRHIDSCRQRLLKINLVKAQEKLKNEQITI